MNTLAGNFQLTRPMHGGVKGGIATWLVTNTWYAAPIFWCVCVAVTIASLFL